MRQFVGAGFQFFEGPLGEGSVGSIVDYGSFVRVALAQDGENVGHSGFPESYVRLRPCLGQLRIQQK